MRGRSLLSVLVSSVVLSGACSSTTPSDPEIVDPGTSGSSGNSGESGTKIVARSGSSGRSGVSGSSGATGTTGRDAGVTSGAASGKSGSSGKSDAGAKDDVGAADSTVAHVPTPSKAGHKFPFPQNRESNHCAYPSYKNEDVTAAYDKWMKDTVTSDGAGGFRRVKRPKEPGLEVNSTVSEGIAYGMIIAVYMDDQELFDDLWKYEQLHAPGGLMDWYISADGTKALGSGPASDADEDMAWALVMADKQWGGAGKLSKSYIDIAKDLLKKIWEVEVQDGKLLKPGSWGGWDTLNISYFAPAYYRVFAQVTGNAGWNDLIKTTYDTIDNALSAENKNQTNGLVPAWCTSDGKQAKNQPFHYQYDSCRTPFRIALDWCFFGEPRAKAYVQKTSGFFGALGASKVGEGYNLDGTPRPEHAKNGEQSAAFLGPTTVGAMHDVSFRDFLEEGYQRVATLDLLIGGTYYDESWTVMSLQMMSGNFLDYTAY